MVIVMVSVTINLISISEGQISLSDVIGESTSNLVESCTEEALLKIKQDNNYAGGFLNINNGECIVTLEKEEIEICNGGGSSCSGEPCGIQEIINETFDSNLGSFSYQDDIYGTNSPENESGNHSTDSECNTGGCGYIELNKNNPIKWENLSGGFITDFNLEKNADVTITFNYTIFNHPETEAYQNEKIILFYKDFKNDNDVQGAVLNADSSSSVSGTIDTELTDVPMGDHTFSLGCLGTEVSYTNEHYECWIDNILIQADYGECEEGCEGGGGGGGGGGGSGESYNCSENVLSRWNFDESSTTTIEDIEGSNNGTLLNGAQKTSSGKFIKGVEFDGDNDRAEVGNFDITGNNLTILTWAKVDEFGDDPRVISKAVGTAIEDHYWQLGYQEYNANSAQVRFRLKTSNGGTSTLHAGTVNINQWHHIAATYDNSKMRLFLNGQEVGDTNKSGNISTNSSASVWFGDNPPDEGSRPFNGILDDVVILNTSLTQEDINTIYQDGLAGKDFCSSYGIETDETGWLITGGVYEIGDIVEYNGKSYECLQSHTTNGDPNWAPDIATALWSEINDLDDDGDDEDDIWNYAVIAQDDINISSPTDINFENGILHAKDDFFMEYNNNLYANHIYVRDRMQFGQNVTIHSDTTAKRYDIYGGGTITGQQNTQNNIPHQDFPDIDINAYKEYAQDNGEYYTRNFYIDSGEGYTPNGGVLYTTRNIYMTNGGNFNGCFIAKNQIYVESGSVVKATNGFPALISERRNVGIYEGGSVEGLIYAPNGFIEKIGPGYIKGQYFAKKDFNLYNNIDNIEFVKSEILLPGEEPEEPEEPCDPISLWDVTVISTYEDYTKTVTLELERSGQHINILNMEELD